VIYKQVAREFLERNKYPADCRPLTTPSSLGLSDGSNWRNVSTNFQSVMTRGILSIRMTAAEDRGDCI
jgi:hypothetical protein